MINFIIPLHIFVGDEDGIVAFAAVDNFSKRSYEIVAVAAVNRDGMTLTVSIDGIIARAAVDYDVPAFIDVIFFQRVEVAVIRVVIVTESANVIIAGTAIDRHVVAETVVHGIISRA